MKEMTMEEHLKRDIEDGFLNQDFSPAKIHAKRSLGIGLTGIGNLNLPAPPQACA